MAIMESGFGAVSDEFTQLFSRARYGDQGAANLVYELAFPRLRRIAELLLIRHRSHHTIQATALAGELFIKLRGFKIPIADREHFFRLSARAMRQVLVDRGRSQAKRKLREAEVLDALLHGHRVAAEDERLVARDIFARFRDTDCKTAEVVRLRYVEDHSWEEISAMTGKEVWRLRDDAKFALGWMRNRLA
jgi:RNA polymerase sigma factor (TIGR02999 family)